ncbi:repeating unit O-acetyltransferase WefK [Streptococcus pneumoniae]|nr:repeating unit O-acetyltransferase WefK [Streptococcus pneumoniae]VKN60732.1 repeating unit O-acetyltransferase WefK [Streptococcus pneumoniae]VLJ91114.1 repeating unit O-acetyltransferase WefK [Streptococcus pneumoniae]VLU77824.1 repeating unit O-acetyltransferase WefK [Streptococcus pneumoniae]VLX19746.1 repeating unit O-acetyltransferase WefK [Streptococcus pneumoniae]
MHKFKDINLDLLKVIACVGVVLLHTEMGGFKETASWNFSTYLYYLGTYSIPLFFIVNGYLLLGKKEITYSYILQKVKWILITVLSWTLIVWLFKRDFSVNPIKKLIGCAKRLFLSVLVFWCAHTYLYMSPRFETIS